MRGRDDVHPAAVRMRAAAPVAAFAAPVAFLIGAAVATAIAGDDLGLWFVGMAAPALVPIAVIAGDTPPIALLVLSGVVSAPLWSLAGRFIAIRTIDRAEGPARWSGFWRRYGRAVLAWVGVATIALAILR